MRVLNVIASLDPIGGGGTAERTFQKSRFLAKAGIDCVILTTDLGLTPERIKALERVQVIKLHCLLKRFCIPRFSYMQIKNIIRNVDIIHLISHWTFLNVLVYFIARRLNKPYVVCPAGALPIYGRSKSFKRFYNWIIGKKIIRNANGYIAITTSEIPQFQVYGVDVNKVSIIPNGVNREDFLMSGDDNFRIKYDLVDCPFILFVGRLNHIKGPDLLLHAFCNVKDKLHAYHLVFIGPDGGMLSSLKEIVSKFGVEDRVHFIGYLGGADKSQAYYTSDLLVIPSRQEAMSIVALEAGITGTPVLLTDKCGFDEIASIGGGLVVTASVDGLQKGLIQIMGDRVKLTSMGENLKRYTQNHFTWNSIVNNYITLYNQILKMDI